MGEDAVPPVKKFGGVAFRVYGVIASTVACRDYLLRRQRSCTTHRYRTVDDIPLEPKTLIVTGIPLNAF